MYFEIDTSNGVAVYEQVYRQVAFAIANGIITSGDLVPSVRAMALPSRRRSQLKPSNLTRGYAPPATKNRKAFPSTISSKISLKISSKA